MLNSAKWIHFYSVFQPLLVKKKTDCLLLSRAKMAEKKREKMDRGKKRSESLFFIKVTPLSLHWVENRLGNRQEVRTNPFFPSGLGIALFAWEIDKSHIDSTDVLPCCPSDHQKYRAQVSWEGKGLHLCILTGSSATAYFSLPFSIFS